MQVTFIILSAAVFFAHVARGLPTDSKKDKPQADPAPAPASPSAPIAPAPEKPETCTATIDGKQETLPTGARYCLDAKTHRVCNYGEWIDNPCDEGSKCLKSPTEWKVLCRIERRNPPQPSHPQDSDVQPSAQSSPEAPSVLAPQSPKREDDRVASPPQPAPPAPAQTKREDDRVPSPSVPAPPPKREDDRVASPPQPEQPKPVEPAPSTPTKTETCKATVDGKEQVFQAGDRYCLDDKTSRVCNYGEFVDFACPDKSKCEKSPEKWEVLCRVINKNVPGADGH